MSFEAIELNAARICDGLRKIGYTPPTAITDIVDNSVQSDAKNIYIKAQAIVQSDSRRDNVKSYLIIDDGYGMDSDGIKDALTLGASDQNYDPDSLSKFGLGLKSAAFSQGEQLEVVSSNGNSPFQKYIVSLPEVRKRNEYGASKAELSQKDKNLISDYLPDKRGTIIRIAKIRANNHPSIRSTFKELSTKIGIIYYYMMSDNSVKMFLVDIDGKKLECKPFDVLFTDEAENNGDLDENSWDGRQTMWVERKREITLDPAENIKAQIEVTQLPHPPTFEENQAKIRQQYMIGAKNYGYYVYRNKRLLSWAETFDIIPRDQDLYSFRGRILIDSTADEVFNIDVKKSQLYPSEEARNAINDLADKHKRKSSKAWQNAGAILKRKQSQNPNNKSNEIIDTIDIPEELSSHPLVAEDYPEVEKRQADLEKREKKRAQEIAKINYTEDPKLSQSAPTNLDDMTDEQIEKGVLTGEIQHDDRIHHVSNTEDNCLWEPFYFNGRDCVRINKLHRFSRVVYEDNKNNSSLIILFNLFLLHASVAEYFVLRKTKTKYPVGEIEEILAEYRRITTDYLANLCREAGDSLPKD